MIFLLRKQCLYIVYSHQRWRVISIITLLLLVYNKTLWAQVLSQETRPLELYNLIEIALKRNLTKNKASLELINKKTELNISRSNFLPQVSLSHSQDVNHSHTLDQTVRTANSGVSLSYNVFNFGKDLASYHAVKSDTEKAELDQTTLIRNLILEISIQYYTILSLYEEHAAALSTEEAYLETLHAAQLKHRLGLVTLNDVLQAESSYSQTKLNTINIVNSINKAHAALNNLLNVEPNTKVILAKHKIQVENNLNDVEDYIIKAKQNRSEILSLNKQKTMLNYKLLEAQLSNLPSINFKASSIRQKNFVRQHFDNALLKVNDYGWSSSFGISISMPIFVGFAKYNQIKLIRNEINLAEINILQEYKKVSLEVWNAYQDYKSAYEGYNTSLALLLTAEKNQSLVMGMYKNGKASILDLLTAQSNHAKAKSNVIKYKYNLINNKLNLFASTGELNVQTLLNIVGNNNA